MVDILLFDKDGTLGYFRDEDDGFFPGAVEFVRSQGTRWRYIMTDASESSRKAHLDELDPTINMRVFGRETLGSIDSVMASLRKGGYTGEGYQNPYFEHGFYSKDLHVVRILISPQDPSALRCVMVGDQGDADSHGSDPYTPLVVISDATRAGDWDPVEIAVEKLFSDDRLQTWEAFDRLLANATGNGASEAILDQPCYPLELGGFTYKIQMIEGNAFAADGRVIYCP